MMIARVKVYSRTNLFDELKSIQMSCDHGGCLQML